MKLKKAFSIIELIIFIVVIGLLTSQLPTMFQIINKKNAFSKTEDGVFNTISLIDNIRYLPWDIQNIEYRDIIQVNSNINLDCNFTRKFGFKNRTCSNNLSIQYSNLETTIDGWKDKTTKTIHNNVEIYRLVSDVSFVNDNIFINESGKIYIDLSQTNDVNESNIKKIHVYSIGTKLDNTEFLIEDLTYYSTNIGHILIEKRDW